MLKVVETKHSEIQALSEADLVEVSGGGSDGGGLIRTF